MTLTAPPVATRHLRPGTALVLVSLTAVLANASWFSATAVVPALQQQWHLTSAGAAWLVIVVQLGFVVGSIAAAALNLPDRLEPRRLISGSALAAGLTNLGLLAAHGLAIALPVRMLVGVSLAGVYAPGVRLVATYFARGRGVATGVIVGALTLGSATPHLVRAVGSVPWQGTIVATSGLAAGPSLLIRPVQAGPGAVAAPPLDLGAAARALVREGPLRLVTLGYLGHMWELYALWAWMASFFVASRRATTGAVPGVTETGVTVFVAIGLAGLIGCVAAGWLADRIGRPAVTGGAMVLSASCCLASPVTFGSSRSVLLGVLTIWGVTVIADSAQFSAATTELADPRYAGSILALQLAFGFALTAASIRLVPAVAAGLGWQYALVPLTVGPLLGTAAMLRLSSTAARRVRAARDHGGPRHSCTTMG